jgi:ABC-2 type transport system permease protein
MMLRASGVCAARILLQLARNGRELLFWFAFPAAMLLLFAVMYAKPEFAKNIPFDTIPPGILVGAALFFACTGGPATVVVSERQQGTFRRLILSPPGPASVVIGTLGAYLVVGFVQAVIVYGLALFFHGNMRFDYGLALLVLVLSIASYVACGVTSAAAFSRRPGEIMAPIAAIGVPLLCISGTFFPVTMMPDTMQRIAAATPIYHMIRAMTAITAHRAGVTAVAGDLVYLTGFAIVATAVAAFAFGRIEAAERT